jgi:hypothetical protein
MTGARPMHMLRTAWGASTLHVACLRTEHMNAASDAGDHTQCSHLQRLDVIDLFSVDRPSDEVIELCVDDAQVGVELAQTRHQLVCEREVPVRQIKCASMLLQSNTRLTSKLLHSAQSPTQAHNLEAHASSHPRFESPNAACRKSTLAGGNVHRHRIVR